MKSYYPGRRTPSPRHNPVTWLADKATRCAGAGWEAGVVSGHDAVTSIAAIVGHKVVTIFVHLVFVRTVHKFHLGFFRPGLR